MDDRLLVCQARYNVYALLQRLYQSPPDRDLLDWLIAERPFREFPFELEGAAAALDQLDRGAREQSLDDLRRDFNRLFIGPGAMLAPPWESVYRNEDHLLFDQHTLQVREFYARHGMEFVKLNQVPEDSIAIELEFMKVLTERLLRALETADSTAERLLLQEQQQFLQQHLLVWSPKFITLTQKGAETAFYHGLAGVLGGFLSWEDQTLKLLLEHVEDIVPAATGG